MVYYNQDIGEFQFTSKKEVDRMSKKLSEYTDTDLAWGLLYFVILLALAIGGIVLFNHFFS